MELFYHSTHNVNLSDDPIYKVAKSFNENINLPTLAYVLPIGVLLNFFNNSIVLLVFFKSKMVAKQITPTLKLYYLIIAMVDLSTSIPLHLTYFSGKLIF